MHQSKLRELVLGVETAVAALFAPAGEAPSERARADVRTAWSALATHLAVGPAPATRLCPACHAVIMRDATRCKACWETSDPPVA